VTVQLDTMTSIDALQTKGAAQRMDQLLRNENSFIAEISTVVTEEVLTPLQVRRHKKHKKLLTRACLLHMCPAPVCFCLGRRAET